MFQKFEYQEENNILLLKFDGIEIKNKQDLQNLRRDLGDFIENSQKKKEKVNCLVNYDGFKVTEEMIDDYADFCIEHGKKYYKTITRYSEKNCTSFWEIFDNALRKRNIENTEIFDVYLDGYVVKGNRNLRNGETVTLANTEVMLGMDTKTGKKVAIKIFDTKSYDVELLRKEIDIHQRIQHENIAKLIKVVEQDSFIYMILQYASKGPISKILEPHKNFEEEDCKKYMKQIISALDYLHNELRVAHRDLHLGNICLTDENDVLIIDFGCSDYFNVEQKTFIFCGRLQYSPPEMFTKKEYVGPEVDIWALGVCLCRMVTGYLPFNFSTDIMNGDFSIELEKENITENCRDLIEKILNVKNRIVDLNEIKHHCWF
jgi:hypothetical protein